MTGTDIHGPLSEDEVLALAASGRLKPSDRIRAESEPRWRLAREIRGYLPPPDDAPGEAARGSMQARPLSIAWVCATVLAVSLVTGAGVWMAMALARERTPESTSVPTDDVEAAKWYQRAAERGDADAAMKLAVIYANGKGVEKNRETALEWLRRAADLGSAESQLALSGLYLWGSAGLVEKDIDKSVMWLRKAANQGNMRAQMTLAFWLDNGFVLTESKSEAARWYLEAAKKGNPEAQFSIGEAYSSGAGVTKDPVAAATWYRRAADQGYIDAQRRLGDMYRHGRGVAMDAAESLNWYRRAAERGDVSSMHSIGSIYALGDGVLKNNVGAYAWYNLAAAHGDEGAKSMRDKVVAPFMTPEQIAEAQRQSTEIQKTFSAPEKSSPLDLLKPYFLLGD